MGEVFVGIDAGTSMIKAVAFDASGRQLAVGAEQNETLSGAGGAAEQDMAAVWHRTVGAIRRLTDSHPDLARRIAAVGVTGQGDGTWPVDGRGEPAARAMLWLDGRAASVVADLTMRGLDRTIFARTGTVISPSLQSMQLAWCERAGQDWLKRADRLLHCKDWLHYKLTGALVTDGSEAVNSFGNLATRTYDDELIGLLGLGSRRKLLAEFEPGRATAHPLTPAAASATGLRAGTPVALAPPDYVATAVGMGLLDPARQLGGTILGSAGVHLMVDTDAALVLARAPCGYCVLTPKEGVYLRMISHMTASLTVDWLADRISGIVEASTGQKIKRMALIAILEREAARAQPCSVVFHPFLSDAGERAPFVDANARGQLLGLTTATGFGEVMRAVLEGLGFAAVDCYGEMTRAPRQIVLSGGVSNSPLMRRIMASVLDAPILLSEQHEAGALGAALVAAVACGRFGSLDQGATGWIEHRPADERPEPALSEIYKRAYPIYRQSYRALAPFWAAHGALRAEAAVSGANA